MCGCELLLDLLRAAGAVLSPNPCCLKAAPCSFLSLGTCSAVRKALSFAAWWAKSRFVGSVTSAVDERSSREMHQEFKAFGPPSHSAFGQSLVSQSAIMSESSTRIISIFWSM